MGYLGYCTLHYGITEYDNEYMGPNPGATSKNLDRDAQPFLKNKAHAYGNSNTLETPSLMEIPNKIDPSLWRFLKR